MELKVCRHDWYYDMGIIGFMNILDFANKEYRVDGDCIKFDSSVLKDFQEDYFGYMIKKFAEPSRRDILDNLKKLKELSSKINSADAAQKKKIDITGEITSIVEKLQKIKSTGYEERLKEIKNLLKNGKKQKKELSSFVPGLIDEIFEILNAEDFKNRYFQKHITQTLFFTFFGQISFLNIVNASKSLEEWKSIFRKDYINPIFESIIDEKDAKKDYSMKCSICNIYEASNSKRKFTETTFVPLGSSEKNFNIFWGSEAPKICDLCSLIMMCTPAGSFQINYKIVSENKNPVYKNLHMFVSTNDPLTVLKDFLNNFEMRIQKREITNPFSEIVYDYLDLVKQKSEWTLENILFVEFDANYQSKKAELHYFRIPRYLAKFFVDQSRVISGIKDHNLSIQMITNFLDFSKASDLINAYLRDFIKENRFRMMSYYAFLASQADEILDLYRREWRDIAVKEKAEEIRKKLWVAYSSGKEMSLILRSRGEENKIRGIAYRLSNAVKTGNKNLFMDTLIRLCMSLGKQVPSVFIESLSGKLGFESVAHSFIAGLVSTEESEKISQSEEKQEVN